MSQEVFFPKSSGSPPPESAKTREKDGFRGVLNIFQLGDIIQMYCLSGASITLRVKLGSQAGSIFIRKGNIVHAVCNETVGEEAFFQIISWKSGDFETVGDAGEPETTIDRNWQFLLLEGARMADELALANDHGLGGKAPLSATRDSESVRVLIVDDSPLMCNILQDLFSADEAIQVVGVAHNGEEALRRIEERKPNLVTLDINIKNEGSEGTVLVQAAVTQAGKTITNEMPVFVKKGATGETKMTFPLVWKGGETTYTIKAITP